MLTPGDRIGDWVVESPLGQGAMGSVYRCHHVVTGKLKVAVKIIHSREEGFVREVEALARLSHPSIIGIRSPGVDPVRGVSFLAMELVDGETLRERMARGISMVEALRICSKIASALAEAHRCSVFHRDVKPANIMLRSDGSPVLVDFGVAADRRVQEGEGLPVGTPSYMPPEVFEGKHADPERSDVYALGVILFELLAGQRAFAAKESGRRSRLEETRQQKLLKKPLDLLEFQDTRPIPQPIRDLVLRATWPAPDAPKPLPMREFADLLENYLAQLTQEPSMGTLAPKGVAKPRRAALREWVVWLVGAAAMALLLSLVGGGMAWWVVRAVMGASH